MLANKKYIGYLRVSTDIQDNQRQKDIITDIVLQNNSTVSFISDSLSGGNLNREGYNSLLQLSNKDYDILIVTEFSRLSRSDEHITVLANIQSILNNGIGVYIINSNKFLAPFTKLDLIELITLIVESDAAAKERIKIKERLLSGRISKVIQNPLRFAHPLPPFGYRFSKDGKKHLVIEPKESLIVLKIFTLHSKGYPTNKIASIVKMPQQTVYSILQNKIYTSIRVFSNKEIDIAHLIEPIVSRDLFKACREVSKTLVQPNYTNILKSLIKCCKCGSDLNIVGRNYVCSECSTSINVKAVSTLLEHIAHKTDNNAEFKKAKQKQQRKVSKEIKLLELSVSDLEAQLTSLDKQRRKLNREHLKGVYKPSEYTELRSDLLNDIEALNTKKRQIRYKISNLKAFHLPTEFHQLKGYKKINSKPALRKYLLSIIANIQIEVLSAKNRTVYINLLDGSTQIYTYKSIKSKNLEDTVYVRTDYGYTVPYCDIDILNSYGIEVIEKKIIGFKSRFKQYTFIDSNQKMFRLTETMLPEKEIVR